ncbi:fibroblast growth factor-binding protein 1 [Betta splendens]|uniref:Fibroblast growth factor-binding protein 1 n=1 Tax=Betta splendens TaxID=158456 RepID=A0A6P7NPN5_BETSP|nr:fibroblast growth factor-binding protein 1 [Betta splendens]
MPPPRTFAAGLLMLAFLGQHVSSASSKNREAHQNAPPAPGRGQSAGDRPSATARGKFSIKHDTMECTWRAKDVGDSVTLAVKCQKPQARASSLTCQYTGRPQLCGGYLSDNSAFWKQVARALKRFQGRVCADGRAPVKAGMCKRAPRDAHFKLDAMDSLGPETSSGGPGSRPPARSTSAAPTACTGRADHRRAAEEYCSSSWSSVCSFLFSMLQSDC